MLYESLFMKISTFSVSWKNLCFKTTFSKTIGLTQRIHSWIAFDLKNVQKLVRSQLNTQTCMRAVNRQPMFTARGTRRAFSPSRFVILYNFHARWSDNNVWRTDLHNWKSLKCVKNLDFSEIFSHFHIMLFACQESSRMLPDLPSYNCFYF